MKSDINIYKYFYNSKLLSRKLKLYLSSYDLYSVRLMSFLEEFDLVSKIDSPCEIVNFILNENNANSIRKFVYKYNNYCIRLVKKYKYDYNDYSLVDLLDE